MKELAAFMLDPKKVQERNGHRQDSPLKTPIELVKKKRGSTA
jgi:hypothetical protein